MLACATASRESTPRLPAGRFGHAGRVESARIAARQPDARSLAGGARPRNLRLTDRQARGVVSNSRANGHFFTSRPLSRVERVPVDQQRTAIQDWSRRAAGESSSRAAQAGQTGGRGEAARAASPGAGNQRAAEGSTTRQNGRSARVYNAEPERPGTSAGSSGWRRLGETPHATGTDAAAGAQADSSADRGAPASSGQPGWRNAAEPASGGRPADSGWVRFGDPRGGATPAAEKFTQREPAAQNGGAKREATPDASQGRTAGGNAWGRFGDPARGATSGGTRSTPPRAPAAVDRGKGPSTPSGAGRAAPSGKTSAPPARSSGQRGRLRSSLGPSDGWSQSTAGQAASSFNSGNMTGGSSARAGVSGEGESQPAVSYGRQSDSFRASPGYSRATPAYRAPSFSAPSGGRGSFGGGIRGSSGGSRPSFGGGGGQRSFGGRSGGGGRRR